MSTENQIKDLEGQALSLAEQIKDKSAVEKDRYDSIKAEIIRIDGELEEKRAEKRREDLETQVKGLTDRLNDALRPASKAASILHGANLGAPGEDDDAAHPGGAYLKALWAAKNGEPETLRAIKATLGDSDANGAYAIPYNLKTAIIEYATAENVWRRVLNVVTGVRGAGVTIPYEANDSSLGQAMLQGGNAQSFGSNKDTRDFTLNAASATLYTVARIIDVGNQLLRQSSGVIENLVRSKLGRAIALAEAYYIVSGTGTSQPKGLANGSGITSTALSSEPRAATIGRAIGKVEARYHSVSAVVVNTADYWELVTEGLGTSYAGGWAVAPADGASASNAASPAFNLWGVPVYRDPLVGTGTAYVGAFREMDLFFGEDFNIRVSDEAANRFDRNITGFRGEEEMGFNADPYVPLYEKVTGI